MARRPVYLLTLKPSPRLELRTLAGYITYHLIPHFSFSLCGIHTHLQSKLAQAVTLCKVSGSDLDRETGYLEVSLGSPPYPLSNSRIFSQLDQESSRKSMMERDVYWIYLAQGAYRWRFPVNAVMELRVP